MPSHIAGRHRVRPAAHGRGWFSLFRQYSRLVDALKLAGVQSSSGLEKAGLRRVHTVSIGFARRCAPAHTVSIGRSRFY